jgi:hypothetical protein
MEQLKQWEAAPKQPSSKAPKGTSWGLSGGRLLIIQSTWMISPFGWTMPFSNTPILSWAQTQWWRRVSGECASFGKDYEGSRWCVDHQEKKDDLIIDRDQDKMKTGSVILITKTTIMKQEFIDKSQLLVRMTVIYEARRSRYNKIVLEILFNKNRYPSAKKTINQVFINQLFFLLETLFDTNRYPSTEGIINVLLINQLFFPLLVFSLPPFLLLNLTFCCWSSS